MARTLLPQPERGKAANFYGHLGTVGRVFMQIEQAGFDLLEPNT